jgi:hypothetical protein
VLSSNQNNTHVALRKGELRMPQDITYKMPTELKPFVQAMLEASGLKEFDAITSVLFAVTTHIDLEQYPILVYGGSMGTGKSVASDEEERVIQQCNEWIIQKGLPEGQYMYELADPDSGEPLAVLDLAWPSGFQEGYSQPVALLIDEEKETEEIVNRAGYRYFADVGSLKKYVEEQILTFAIRSS